MHHILILTSRLQQPLKLRYRKEKTLDSAWDYLEGTKSGRMSLEDDCGTTVRVDTADVVALMRVDTAADTDAAVEEALAQHKAQMRAQQSANMMPGIMQPRGLMS